MLAVCVHVKVMKVVLKVTAALQFSFSWSLRYRSIYSAYDYVFCSAEGYWLLQDVKTVSHVAFRLFRRTEDQITI